uniref:Uncharacterized protein n=1 Tax=Tanacetum cinerariifolium TaxID=118510 RepID=A0A6L2NJ27_TANCI|nr:hypothetical protein [Tanacetum cinerariifolium]
MNESPILKRLRSETSVKLITFHDNIWAIKGDGDDLLFLVRSLPTPVCRLRSHAMNVNAAVAGSGGHHYIVIAAMAGRISFYPVRVPMTSRVSTDARGNECEGHFSLINEVKIMKRQLSEDQAKEAREWEVTAKGKQAVAEERDRIV